jgi:hypothetical protein
MEFPGRAVRLFIVTACLLVVYSFSEAQSDHTLGAWHVVYVKGNISPKLSFMGEGNLRTYNYDFKFDYLEVKGGIYYALVKNLWCLAGAGIINLYPPGGFLKPPATQKEFRTWFELFYIHSSGRFYFDHRFRIEQRFIPENYKNRIKYRFGFRVPINKRRIEEGSAYIAVNDELYIPQYGPPIEKNRIYAGAGYKISKSTTFQVGYARDYNYTIHTLSVRDYLQLLLIYDFANKLRKHT